MKSRRPYTLTPKLRAAIRELNERGFWVVKARSLCADMCDQYVKKPTKKEKEAGVVSCAYPVNSSGRCLQHWCVYGQPLHFVGDGQRAVGFNTKGGCYDRECGKREGRG